MAQMRMMAEATFREVVVTWLLRAGHVSGLSRGLQRFERLYRVLRAAFTRLTRSVNTQTIACGPLRGYRMVLGPRDRYAYLVNEHERKIVEVASQLCRPSMHVLDVGGHVGYYTLLFSTLVGPSGRVYTLEPNPANLEKLRAMLIANDITNVEIFPIAAGDRTGKVHFFTEQTGQMGRVAQADMTDEGIISVQSARIDDLIQSRGIERIDLVKMDVEGAERPALKGMCELLSSVRPLVICEWHPLIAGLDYEEAFNSFNYSCELLGSADAETEPFHVLATPRS